MEREAYKMITKKIILHVKKERKKSNKRERESFNCISIVT